MSKKWLLLLLVAFCFFSGCQNNSSGQFETKSQLHKNVVMIMIDSMTSNLVEESLKTGDFPALQFLIDHGRIYPDLVAPFPSMSVSIEASLITGKMPRDHHIPGLTWYDKEEDRLVDYGTSFETLRKVGINQTIIDAMYNLNNVHLNKKQTTIFDELQQKGITTGSINLLLHRGKSEHELTIPPILSQVIGTPKTLKTISSDTFAFGMFHHPDELKKQILPDTFVQRAGFNDNYASDVILKLKSINKQPQFTLAFFPEMDKKTHKNGPENVSGFKEVEKHLQHLLDSYGSWEDALDQTVFILFGDHGQDKLVEDEKQTKINLYKLFESYNVAGFSEKPSNGELVIANNHRMAFIFISSKKVNKAEIAKSAVTDSRMAISAFIDKDDWIHVWSSDNNDTFSFKKHGKWKDKYKQSWSIKGNKGVLNLSIDEENTEIKYNDYPDALNQLHSALLSQQDSIVVTAKPGYVVYSETTPVHNGGGEHGGLHKNDTLAALIISGTDKIPDKLRIMDLKPFILSLFEEDQSNRIY
ncbi:alkaline phosphatase family protein [Litchfieldia alkalitelluris]|uniref:alkaline phosphatase family protein n=1 Tax=Litchfieldia alkalitelluris TaxID=304268 RepID=UPI000997F273|nr:alkaline phosphatase family protein [Litchfieldia alkalitelluris]